MRRKTLLLILCVLTSAYAASSAKKTVPSPSASTIVSGDKISPSAPGKVKIGGYLGEKIDLCIDNRVMVQDIDAFVAPFRDRKESRGG